MLWKVQAELCSLIAEVSQTLYFYSPPSQEIWGQIEFGRKDWNIHGKCLPISAALYISHPVPLQRDGIQWLRKPGNLHREVMQEKQLVSI